MSKVQVEIACPGCQQKFPMALEDITPGRSQACPSCGTTMKFSGAEGGKLQKAPRPAGEEGEGHDHGQDQAEGVAGEQFVRRIGGAT